jgi:hypothetical protein
MKIGRDYLAVLLLHETRFLRMQRKADEVAHINTLAEQNLLPSHGPNHYLTRQAMLDVAACLAELGRVLETESKIREVLGNAFEVVCALGSGTTSYPSYGAAVNVVTQGHDSLVFKDSDLYVFCYCSEGRLGGEDWNHEGSGRLRTNEVQIHANAFQIMGSICFEQKQVQLLE